MIEVFPLKAQYRRGEIVKIKVLINDISADKEAFLRCNIYNLQNKLKTIKKEITEADKEVVFEIIIDETSKVLAGYGVEVQFYEGAEIKESVVTAFDITEEWYNAPRYGFISDFFKSDLDDGEDVKQLNKYHLNVIQFYDWMYRHHELIPPANDFIDPLGRELSFDVVKQKIDYCHSYGMKALGYGAVYGSEKEFYEKHKDMALYKNDDKVLAFIDFIYMMDINRENPWHDHIIKEFYSAIQFGFDGIHMDQYGFPKESLSKLHGENTVRHLRNDFPELINDTRKYIEEQGSEVNLIFNAVNNWPIDAVASANQDCMYIEVWPPNEEFQDLYTLITNAKRYESKKQVILAAYMKPFSKNVNAPAEYAQNATLLTMATIFASGGFHLLLGEKNGMLTEAYYPDYAVASEIFSKQLKSYYDFIVRYEELLFDLTMIDNSMTYTGGINGEYVFNGCNVSPKAEKDSVWTLVKEKQGYKIINLVNFTGIENMNWNEEKEKQPDVLENIEVTALVIEKIKGIYAVSPDFNESEAISLEYEYVKHDQGQAVKFTVPKLKVWDLIYIEVEE